MAERLLDDDARVRRQPGLGQALDDRAEQERRDLEVEDRLLGALDRLGDPLVGGGIAEVALRRRRTAPPSRSNTCVVELSRRCPRSSSRARSSSWSTVQSSTATPTIGQSSSPRFSSRYSERNVITFARSPVIPKHDDISGRCCPSPASSAVRHRCCGRHPRLAPHRYGLDPDPARALVGEARPQAQSTTAFARSSLVGSSAR